MRKISQADLEAAARLHAEWLEDEKEGQCADFSHCDLSGVNFAFKDFSYASFCFADLSFSCFNQADLRGANFEGADFSCASMCCVDAEDAYFKKCCFLDACVAGSKMIRANFSYADFERSIFSRADMAEANLYSVSLEGVVGNGREIVSINFFDISIAYTSHVLQINTYRKPISKWWALDESSIERMGLASFWRKNKEIIRELIEVNPACGSRWR